MIVDFHGFSKARLISGDRGLSWEPPVFRQVTSITPGSSWSTSVLPVSKATPWALLDKIPTGRRKNSTGSMKTQPLRIPIDERLCRDMFFFSETYAISLWDFNPGQPCKFHSSEVYPYIQSRFYRSPEATCGDLFSNWGMRAQRLLETVDTRHSASCCKTFQTLSQTQVFDPHVASETNFRRSRCTGALGSSIHKCHRHVK